MEGSGATRSRRRLAGGMEPAGAARVGEAAIWRSRQRGRGGRGAERRRVEEAAAIGGIE